MDRAWGPFIRVSRVDDECVVTVDGEIDLSSVGKLLQLIEAATDDALRVFVLDLSSVTYIDSEGLKALLLLKNDLELAGRTLCFRACSAIVRRVLGVLALKESVGCGRGCNLRPCE